MKLTLLFFLVLAASSNADEKTAPCNMSADFTPDISIAISQDVVYGCGFFDWRGRNNKDDRIYWNDRPASASLTPFDYEPREDLNIFEAKGLFVVNTATKKFTADRLHRLSTVKAIEEDATHEEIKREDVSEPFAVRSTVDFPETWKPIIALGKMAGQIDEDNDTFLQFKSRFYFADEKTLHAENLQEWREKVIAPLDTLAEGTLKAVNIQEINEFNQIGQYGRTVTLFYEITPKKTAILIYAVLAVEADVMRMGLRDRFQVENVLLRTKKVPGITKEEGIGAGLPQYTLETFKAMKTFFESF